MVTGGQCVKFVDVFYEHGTVRLVGERSERGSLVTIDYGDRLTATRWEDELLDPHWTGRCPLHLDFMAQKKRANP